MLNFNREAIEKMDMSYAMDICVAERNDFYMNPGTGPYKLYAYLSSQYNGITILDVGTLNGNSALSFSYNENNKVISYDINDHGASKISKKNITWKLKDFRDDETINFDDVKIIFIDIDHNGDEEMEMIEFIRKKKWSGILLFDDIYLNEDMRKLWDSFPENIKTDLTAVGHASGTGMVIID